MTEQVDRLARVRVGDKFCILDGHGQVLGDLEVRDMEDTAVTATFRPGPAFASVRRLFAKHAEAIEDMMMAKEEELHQKIGAMGLHLETPERKPGPLIHGLIIREQQAEAYFHLRGGYPADHRELAGESK